MVAESLPKMILKACENGLIVGLPSNLIDKGVVLQYDDDTVLCIQHDLEKAINLKLLYMFEMLSGLKINYLKSEFISIGVDNDVMALYANMFNSQDEKIPMKYFGVLVTFSNSKNID
jgi:hypothetical protein